MLLLFFFLSLWAQEKINLYTEIGLGEKDFNQYFGHLDPLIKKTRTGEKTEFFDTYFHQNYLQEFTSPAVFDLFNFISQDLLKASKCPNYYLESHASYIKYLFRLLTISYVFENLKALKITSYNLGFGEICSLEWEQTFKKCRARDISMAQFVKRVQGNHLKDFTKSALIKMKNEERENWLKKFHQNAFKYSELDLSEARIVSFCLENKINCQTISLDDLKFAFQLSCTEDQNLLLNICSNNDSLYGISYVKGASRLIEESNAFSKLDSEGFGKYCIERFIDFYRQKEVKVSMLASIFPKVSELLVKEKKAYKQGSLFIYGTLADFDPKGLEGFLFTEPAPNVKNKMEISLLPIKQTAASLEIPTLNGLIDLANSLKKNSGIDSSKSQKLSSQLVSAELKRFMNDKPKEPLNMVLFKKEAPFSATLEEGMLERIDLYGKKVTLEKLKSNEGLGSVQAPYPLSVLKYFVDFNDQHYLNNLLAVLGEKFYIVNDLEPNAKNFYIELKHEKNSWQISTLKKDNQDSIKFK